MQKKKVKPRPKNIILPWAPARTRLIFAYDHIVASKNGKVTFLLNGEEYIEPFVIEYHQSKIIYRFKGKEGSKTIALVYNNEIIGSQELPKVVLGPGDTLVLNYTYEVK